MTPLLELSADDMAQLLKTLTAPEPSCDGPLPRPDARARRREIERLSRRRRQSELQAMREDLRELECHFARLSTASPSDTDDVASESSSQSVRALQRRFRRLAREARLLEDEKEGLQRMFSTRQLLTFSTHQLVEQYMDHAERHPVEIGLISAMFEPLARTEYVRLIQEAFKASHWPHDGDCRSTGNACFGWQDQWQLDDGRLRINVTKRLLRQRAEQLLQDTWQLLIDSDQLHRSLGDAQSSVVTRILETINDDTIVMYRRYSRIGVNAKHHTIAIFYRLRLDDGFFMGIVSIPSPGAQCAISDPDVWNESNSWIRFENVRDDEQGHIIGSDVTFGGIIQVEKIQSLPRFLFGSLMSSVRWETVVTSARILTVV